MGTKHGPKHQLMLMMLALGGHATNIAQLMLMMLAALGQWHKAWPADAHDAGLTFLGTAAAPAGHASDAHDAGRVFPKAKDGQLMLMMLAWFGANAAKTRPS